MYSFMAIEDTEELKDLDKSDRGKWMLSYIALYLAVITSYILNAKEFKTIYIDNAPEEDSDSEEEEYYKKSDSEENSEDDEDIEDEETNDTF